MQETRVWSLVQEDPTCCRATKPVCHTEPVLWSLGTPTTEFTCRNYWSPCTAEPILCNKRSHYNNKPMHLVKKSLHNDKDSAQPKINKKQEKKMFQTLCKKDGCVKPTGDIPVLHCHEHVQLHSKRGKNHEGSSPKRQLNNGLHGSKEAPGGKPQTISSSRPWSKRLIIMISLWTTRSSYCMKWLS